LELIKDFFQCGKIYVNRRYDNHREHVYRYCVRSLKDIREIIIPFFVQYKLKTNKVNDFMVFCKAVAIMTSREHLTKKGFQEIITLKSQLNRKILRDYMSDPVTAGKI